MFAGAALLLAALGVYGIVAYSVSQRSREFGIRMALGARAPQIVGMVVLQNLRTVVLGLVLGLACAIPATRLLRGLLFQVGPNDPVTFVVDRCRAGGGRTRSPPTCPHGAGRRVDPVVTLKAE